jgi:hypothetical protein
MQRAAFFAGEEKMKRLFLTAATAALCLSACGQSNKDNGAGNAANASAGTGTGTGTGMGTGGMSTPAPAPDMNMSGNTAVGGDMRSQIVGRWGKNASCGESMEFRADGGLSIPGTALPPQVRWEVRGNSIVLSGPGGVSQPIGTFSMGAGGSTMQLTTATGETTNLTRCS